MGGGGNTESSKISRNLAGLEAWTGAAWQGVAGPGKAGHGFLKKLTKGMEILASKNIIELEPLIVTKPARYQISIKGMDAILFNKMPDQSKSKTELKNQEKIDPIERERMMWREKAYFDADGMLYVPGENIHECMKQGAQYWGQKIPGAGNKTYTDVVNSAVVVENMLLGVHKDDDKLIPFGKSVNGNPSKGKKSGAKVYKIRPLLRPWGGTFVIHVFDGRLTLSVLKTVLTYAGAFRGLCDWRPVYGRFELEKIEQI